MPRFLFGGMNAKKGKQADDGARPIAGGLRWARLRRERSFDSLGRAGDRFEAKLGVRRDFAELKFLRSEGTALDHAREVLAEV